MVIYLHEIYNLCLKENHDSHDENFHYYMTIMEQCFNMRYLTELVFVLELLEDTNRDFEDVKVTISKDEFNKYKYVKCDNCSCSICLENIKSFATKIPCGHLFHKKCIKNWLCNENVKCPLCRKDVRD